VKKSLQLASKRRDLAHKTAYLKKLARKGKSYDTRRALTTRQLGNEVYVEAPEVVSIYRVNAQTSRLERSPYERTLRFILAVKKQLKKSKCVLDFRGTQVVTAAALVVLYAEIESIVTDVDFKHRVALPTAKGAAKAIKNSGLMRLLNGRPLEKNFKELEKIPIIRGAGKEHLEEILNHIQERVYDNKMDANTEYLFGDAVSETINNVGRHAYPGKRDYEKEWWLTCEVIGDQLYLAIYDRGVGIPRTVVEQPWFLVSFKSMFPKQYQEVQDALEEVAPDVKLYAFKRLKDSELIYISMKGDISGTQKSKHGQGSKSIKALVNDTIGGKLWVFSRKGLYKFQSSDELPKLIKLPVELRGTLLQWNITIK